MDAIVKTEQVTLTGATLYNEKYPPAGAKKGYVAKITGRAAGAMKYEREFLGSTAEIFEGDEGLYERQVGKKKGGYTRWYHVVLAHHEYGLIVSSDCENEAPKIAKLLADGFEIEDVVTYDKLIPSLNVQGRMSFNVVVRTPAQAKKAAKAANIYSATAYCWSVLSAFDPADAKKMLTELRKRLADKTREDK